MEEHELNDGHDDEFGLVGPTLMVTIGSGALLLAGLLSFLAGLLIRIGSPPYGWIAPGPWLMMLAGIAVLPLAGWFGRARDWAAIGSAAVALFLLLLHTVWLALGLVGQFVMTMGSWFHAWQFLAFMSALIAALLLPFGIKDAFVASKNRRKLLE